MARNILLVLQFILPLLTMVLSLFISRNREYMADSGAAYLMRDSEPMIRVPNTGRKGGVSGSKLEISNVDLSRSLTQLIVVQRGFQANSKAVATSDQILNTLLNLL